MPTWLAILIIVSTLGGLLIAGFAMWLSAQEKQAQIGTVTSELEDTVATQQRLLEAAERRIQNLEAIVTSQVWDAVHDEALPASTVKQALAEPRIAPGLIDEAPADAERTAQLARRLKV